MRISARLLSILIFLFIVIGILLYTIFNLSPKSSKIDLNRITATSQVPGYTMNVNKTSSAIAQLNKIGYWDKDGIATWTIRPFTFYTADKIILNVIPLDQNLINNKNQYYQQLDENQSPLIAAETHLDGDNEIINVGVSPVFLNKVSQRNQIQLLEYVFWKGIYYTRIFPHTGSDIPGDDSSFLKSHMDSLGTFYITK